MNGLRQVTCVFRERQLRLYELWRDSLRWIPLIGFFVAEIRRVGPCRGVAHTLHSCVKWSPPEGYVHGEHGVCLGDGQTEAEGPSRGGRGYVLLRRMLQYLT